MSEAQIHHKDTEGCCSHDHAHHKDEGHNHDHGDTGSFKTYIPAIFSLSLLLTAIAFDYFKLGFFVGYIRIGWYVVAYLPVAFPVIKLAVQTIAIGDIFTEFLLMVLATIGALGLGEYPEAVAVMLFYTVGELFQEAAVAGAKRNIKKLLDVRPATASVFRNGNYDLVAPETVDIGENIQLKVGDKAPLDGELLTEIGSFNTAALTGESRPKTFKKGETILAGMLNLDQVVTIKVLKKFNDSALSRILEMVQSATSRKAKTELFIRKFAKIYTPIVFFLAVSLIVLPYFFVANYQFPTWLYRALVFLVISCPCALVISIPLGYFGGIGAASANGILFKGSNFLDIITKVNTVVMDKTGTLTHGVFKVVDVKTEIELERFTELLVGIESQSTHPIAKAIISHYGDKKKVEVTSAKEIAGYGLTAMIKNEQVVAGNVKLLKKMNISYPSALDEQVETLVLLAVADRFAGYVVIADEVKEGAKHAINELHANGIKQIVMLSGDKTSITKKLANELGIEQAFGDLLPEDKVAQLEQLKKDKNNIIAFVGDGINDAPVLALSDVGIAMGAMGSDVAIETADMVIQNDEPGRIVAAIKIGKATKRVVYQNIGLAFVVKAAVLVLGAGGLATMWEAVFADVGVAFLAILNAIRIQQMKF
jgi:Cd2+/Zn2+-exporting ATPase